MIKRLFSVLALWLLLCPTLHAAEALATFAGGCFWCVEASFEQVPGVTAAISGYTGGKLENPGYKQVARGGTGHLESVQVHYDPSRITYEGLLEAFWRMINPTDPDGQFYDRGMQYSTAVFYHDEEQRRIAEASKKRLDATERYVHPVITPIRPLEKFWRAEESHQDYYLKNSFRYTFFRWNSGRDHYLEQIWGDDLALDYAKFVPKGVVGQAATQAAPLKAAPPAEPPAEPQGQPNDAWQKPDEAELRRRLTPLQYDVTQDEGTEPPFKNEYWDEKRAGIYVDRVSGEPLFSSLDKYDSGTGWPSFTRPLAPENIVEESDFRLLLPRTEIRSRIGQSHLGHLFDDGPKPTGLRYCMNSAALRFIPKEKLAEEGYGDYLKLFAK